MPPSLTLPVPVAVLYSPAMAPGYKTGAATRRAILLALLAEEPRTIRGLAAAVGVTENGTRGHVRRMERDGLLMVTRRMGRLGSEVRLTAAGKEAAKLL